MCCVKKWCKQLRGAAVAGAEGGGCDAGVGQGKGCERDAALCAQFYDSTSVSAASSDQLPQLLQLLLCLEQLLLQLLQLLPWRLLARFAAAFVLLGALHSLAVNLVSASRTD